MQMAGVGMFGHDECGHDGNLEERIGGSQFDYIWFIKFWQNELYSC